MDIRQETNRIIFHHSLSNFGNVDIIRNWHHDRGFSDIGYHFVILPDGKLEIGRELKYVGAHASGKNIDSIGVCLIGDFRKDKPKDYQFTTSKYLYNFLCSIYGKLYVQFHHESCPGILLDREKFIKVVIGE